VAKYNIIKDYDWTTIPRGAPLRSKAPRVLVKSYKLKSNALLNRLKNYIQVGTAASSKEFYEKMYGEATEQEDSFNFPYFDSALRTVGNSFDDTFRGSDRLNGVMQELEGIADKAAGAFRFGRDVYNESSTANLAKQAFSFSASFNNRDAKGMGSAINAAIGDAGGAAGSYIEKPKFYDYSSATEGPLTVNFKLANTINSDFMKNYELVKKLVEINKPKRNDAISLDPPRIYRVKMFGYRYMPWAYVDNLAISMEGTKRMIDGVIIPEAYNVSLSFKPLTIEVSNFLDEVK
jgi:hypothetical protein